MRTSLGFLIAALGIACASAPDDTPAPPSAAEVEKAADRFQSLYNSGLLFFHIGDFDRAEEALREAVSHRGADPKPHFYLGRIYLARKQYSLAEKALREALARNPDFTGASLLLAEVYFQSQRLEEGMRHIDSLLESHPGTAEVYYYRGYMHERLDRLAEAVDDFRELLRRDPEHLEGRFHLGLTRMKQQEWEQARKRFEEVLERDPEHFGSLFNLAKAYGRLGRERERAATLERFETLVSRTEGQIYRDTQIGYHTNAGVTHFNNGEFLAAMEEFRKVVELNPRLGRGYFYLGSCFIALERPAEALAPLLRARDLEPEDGRIRIELGRAQALNGDLAAAAEAMRDALRINPYLEMAHFYLVGIYQAMNRQDLSRHHLAEFQRLRALGSGGQGG